MELQKILPDLIKEVVKQTLESIMVVEREVFIKEYGGTKNGFYTRNLDTVLGKLKNLKIPRDREGKFRTRLIEPYMLCPKIRQVKIILPWKETGRNTTENL